MANGSASGWSHSQINLSNRSSSIESSFPDTPAASSSVPSSSLSHNEVREILMNEANYDCDAPTNTPKRSNYLTWDDYFMAIAYLSARRSKDPKSPTGACLVDNDNRVVGIGYNGFPRGCSDDLLPWQRNDDCDDTTTSGGEEGGTTYDTAARPFLHTPSPYECHAETNAILNKCSADVAGTRMYVAHFPCNECAKMIAQSRIRKVIYMSDTNPDSDVYRASRIILHLAGVETMQYKPTIDEIELELLLPTEVVNATCDDPSSNSSCSRLDCDRSNHNTSSDVTKNYDPDDLDLECRNLLFREANWIPPKISTKRRDYLSWDDYFMAMAFLTAKRSKDPNTQVGACIVSRLEHRILALGYNGFPRGCSDDCLPWARRPVLPVVTASTEADQEQQSQVTSTITTTLDTTTQSGGTAATSTSSSSSSSSLHTKYPYVCHAEVNAILNKGSADVRDAILYVALFPCNECAKMIIQAGIVEVVYLQDLYHDTDMCRASRILFRMAGVTLRPLIPRVGRITIDFRSNQ